jgi:uncharacterized protein
MEPDSGALAAKVDHLLSSMCERRNVVVALSGGVDSSVVAAVAQRALGYRAIAMTIDSPLTAAGDIDSARRLASDIGIEHMLVSLNELDIPEVAANTPQRCYECKRLRYSTITSRAVDLGYSTVADGTNASDASEYRPGLAAARDLNIYTPLLEVGLSKEDTRSVARLLGLRCADRPGNACLATRVPYGQPLRPERLKMIDRAETEIRSLTGVSLVRLRDHGSLARIEVSSEEMQIVADADLMKQISSLLRQLGFAFVTLDLEGYRSGSFDQAQSQSL